MFSACLCIIFLTAEELVLSRGGVSREGHTGAAAVVHVAVGHDLHVHGRAPLVGDVVVGPVADGAVVIPGLEHCQYGASQLIAMVVGHVGVELLEFSHHLSRGSSGKNSSSRRSNRCVIIG